MRDMLKWAILRRARKLRDAAVPAPVRGWLEDKQEAIATLAWLVTLTAVCEVAEQARRRREAKEAERSRMSEWLG